MKKNKQAIKSDESFNMTGLQNSATEHFFSFFFFHSQVMSAYPHYTMGSQSLVQLLESIKNEFDKISHEAYVFKMQRDEFEQKSKSFFLLNWYQR